MFQLLILSFLVICTMSLVTGLVVLLAVPGTFFIVTAVVILMAFYSCYKVLMYVANMVHRLSNGLISAQIEYIVEVTPLCSEIIGFWRTFRRRGVIVTSKALVCKSFDMIGQTSISTLQSIANQHELHKKVIQYPLQAILWPIALLIKGMLLIRQWITRACQIIRRVIISLMSPFLNLAIYCFGTTYTAHTIFICLLSAVIHAFTKFLMILLLTPYRMWIWMASFLVSDEIIGHGSGAIFLEVLRKVPLIGRIGIIQTIAADGVRRANHSLERVKTLKDHVITDVRSRYHVIKDGLHFYVDDYCSLPREVILLLVRESFITGPITRIKRWIQENIQFQDILLVTADRAMNEVTVRNHQSVTSDQQCQPKPRTTEG